MDKRIDEEKLVQKILNIMRKRLNLDFDEKAPDIANYPFMGGYFKMQAYELGYLLMEVEKEFDIVIPESYLLKPGVHTIGDFTRAISEFGMEN